jgi:3-deoxy-manno-octulosonate cytidylyltransferase (CMP-KDO synthetase)
MQEAIAIIPARYASTRFPGKPLVEIKGKSMIMRVYEQALKASMLKDVYVATDDHRIYEHVARHGGKAIMTAVHHTSGTERCLEAFHLLQKEKKLSDDEIIINIQGDEPFIHPDQIDSLTNLFSRPEVNIATLMKIITDKAEINNPGCVKVVAGVHKQALYFSRSPVPFIRNAEENQNSPAIFYKHIGMYAYRSKVLEEICKLKASPLEITEKLEQLRWLENGYIIHLETTEHESIAIDFPADLLKVTNIA